MLARLQWTDDEPINRHIYIRVFEAQGKGLVNSGLVIVLDFADVTAEIRTDHDADFVLVNDDPGWGFRAEPIGSRPETLEKLVEMLRSVSTPTVTFRLYTKDQRAVIVREKITEPELVAEPETAPAREPEVTEQTCAAGGHHELTGTTHLLRVDGIPSLQIPYRSCSKCGSLVCVNLTG